MDNAAWRKQSDDNVARPSEGETKGSGLGMQKNLKDPQTRRRVTISLSERSYRAFCELRRLTDADTDSEVFRNALRLHLTLVRAYQSGAELFVRTAESTERVPVTLFVEDEDGELVSG